MRDNILFFVKEGVILLFELDRLVILSHCRRPDIREALIRHGLIHLQDTTAIGRINQRRGMKELTKLCRCRYFDYSDPKLFDAIDETLNIPQTASLQ